jgi:UDP-glucose 4-epimerase
MKVLVTGGAGFIGSQVVDALLAAGHAVAVVDDLSTGRARNLNPGATFYQLDIGDPALADVFAREQPELVNHHAAQIDVRRAVADPLHDARVNILGSLNLLECARRSGVRKIVYSSTGGAVYGEPAYLPCDEAHPIRPLSPYGASKHTVEHYLDLYRANHGLDYTVLRYPNVYGPRQDPLGEAGVVAIFTSAMLRGAPVTIYGDGEQLRDYTFVGDCVAANLLALEHGSGGTYNLGWGQGVSVNTLFGLLAELTGYALSPRYAPARLGEITRTYLDAGRARRELGWSPAVPLAEGLARTVAALREEQPPDL